MLCTWSLGNFHFRAVEGGSCLTGCTSPLGEPPTLKRGGKAAVWSGGPCSLTTRLQGEEQVAALTPTVSWQKAKEQLLCRATACALEQALLPLCAFHLIWALQQSCKATAGDGFMKWTSQGSNQ